MKRLVPDPLQPFDHEGNPEDGPARFIELHRCECGREFNPALVNCCSTCWLDLGRRKSKPVAVA